MSLFKRQLGIIFSLAVLIGIFCLTPQASAADSSTLRGEAWWPSQNSYLYFNCLDDVMGDHFGTQYNLCGGVFFPPNPFVCGSNGYAFHFYAPPCSGSNHVVSILPNGNLTGEAWNNTAGYVSFIGSSTPDNYGFQSNCPSYPSLTCTPANNCTACYNENTQQIYGYAKADDGTWINLNPYPNTASSTQLKNWDPSDVTVPFSSLLNPGDFIGYANTGSSDYISFNCLNNSGGAACNSYKVYIQNLQVGHMSAPNWNFYDACNNSALEARLDWSLKSGASAADPNWPVDYQTGFEIILNTVNSTSSAPFDVKVNGSATQYTVNTNNFPGLSYNTPYYWWLRLKNQNGNWTQWYEFGAMDGHDGLTDTITTDGNGNPMGQTDTNPDVKTFRTYKHAFPTPYFSWSPANIYVGSTTTVWSTGLNGQSCYNNNCSYLWSTSGDPDARFYDNDQGSGTATSSATSTYVIFQHATTSLINLGVTDNDGYTCSTSTSLNVTYVLPIWREIKAQ